MSDDMHVVAYELSNSDGETILVAELVRQSDALAKLAEKDAEIAKRDAEIARLNDALRGIINTAYNLPEFMCIEIMQEQAEKALKGPEA